MNRIALLIPLLLLISCGGPEPRKPLKVRSGSFIKESARRNRQLLEMEEALIGEIIKNDSLHEYIPTASGFWYFYEKSNDQASYTPLPGDRVSFEYTLMSLDNDTIYRQEELGIQDYLVDKEDRAPLFPGLRQGIKILKEGETATFLFPSSLSFGYPGDKDRIGTNVPLKSSITLLDIRKQQENIQNK